MMVRLAAPDGVRETSMAGLLARAPHVEVDDGSPECEALLALGWAPAVEEPAPAPKVKRGSD